CLLFDGSPRFRCSGAGTLRRQLCAYAAYPARQRIVRGGGYFRGDRGGQQCWGRSALSGVGYGEVEYCRADLWQEKRGQEKRGEETGGGGTVYRELLCGHLHHSRAEIHRVLRRPGRAASGIKRRWQRRGVAPRWWKRYFPASPQRLNSRCRRQDNFAALKCARENSVVPPGLESFLQLFPALKRWAKLVRPSGAVFSSSSSHQIAKTPVLTHTLKRWASQKRAQSRVLQRSVKPTLK